MQLKKITTDHGVGPHGIKQRKCLKIITTLYMGNRCKTTIYSLLLLFSLSNCRDRSIGIDQMVECRLYWIEDTYPKDVGKITEKDMRLVCLHYIIIKKSRGRF